MADGENQLSNSVLSQFDLYRIASVVRDSVSDTISSNIPSIIEDVLSNPSGSYQRATIQQNRRLDTISETTRLIRSDTKWMVDTLKRIEKKNDELLEEGGGDLTSGLKGLVPTIGKFIWPIVALYLGHEYVAPWLADQAEKLFGGPTKEQKSEYDKIPNWNIFGIQFKNPGLVLGFTATELLKGAYNAVTPSTDTIEKKLQKEIHPDAAETLTPTPETTPPPETATVAPTVTAKVQIGVISDQKDSNYGQIVQLTEYNPPWYSATILTGQNKNKVITINEQYLKDIRWVTADQLQLSIDNLTTQQKRIGDILSKNEDTLSGSGDTATIAGSAGGDMLSSDSGGGGSYATAPTGSISGDNLFKRDGDTSNPIGAYAPSIRLKDGPMSGGTPYMGSGSIPGNGGGPATAEPVVKPKIPNSVMGPDEREKIGEKPVGGGDARKVAETYLGRSMDDKEWDQLQRITYGEASHTNPQEQAMVAAAVLNRARTQGKSIGEIISAKGQFMAYRTGNYNKGPDEKTSNLITSGISTYLPNVDQGLENFRAASYSGKFSRGDDKVVVGGTRFQTTKIPEALKLSTTGKGDAIAAREEVPTSTKTVIGDVKGGNVQELQGKEAGIRKYPITPDLKRELEYASKKSGVGAEIFSGGQPAKGSGGARTGSIRHDEGNAADMRFFVYEDGKKRYLNETTNPDDIKLMSSFVKASVEAGATGVGSGPSYMGPGTAHIGGGTPMTWGSGGRSGNAPQWLREAYQEGLKDHESFSWEKVLADQKEKSTTSPTTGITEASKPYFPPKTPFGTMNDTGKMVTTVKNENSFAPMAAAGPLTVPKPAKPVEPTPTEPIVESRNKDDSLRAEIDALKKQIADNKKGSVNTTQIVDRTNEKSIKMPQHMKNVIADTHNLPRDDTLSKSISQSAYA